MTFSRMLRVVYESPTFKYLFRALHQELKIWLARHACCGTEGVDANFVPRGCISIRTFGDVRTVQEINWDRILHEPQPFYELSTPGIHCVGVMHDDVQTGIPFLKGHADSLIESLDALSGEEADLRIIVSVIRKTNARDTRPKIVVKWVQKSLREPSTRREELDRVRLK